MKRSVIEHKLNEAMQRRSSAETDVRCCTIDIDYHDGVASKLRRMREKSKAKLDRAKASIQNYQNMLTQHKE